MGRTRKSRVIKVLVSFFKMRNEGHRILILAPTGLAATLLTGYTYHSALGINDNFDYGGMKGVAQVRDKLDGADYIFLDEVSMLSCHDLYRISAQIARAFNIHLAGRISYLQVTLHNFLLLVVENHHRYIVE